MAQKRGFGAAAAVASHKVEEATAPAVAAEREELPQKNAERAKGDGSLSARLAVAKAVLGDEGGESPEEALAAAQAAAAERYVVDLERQARLKVISEEKQARRAEEAAEKAERRRNKLVMTYLSIRESEVHEALIVAAIRRLDLNGLGLEAIHEHLERVSGMAAASAGRAGEQSGNSDIDTRFQIAIPQHLLDRLWEVAKALGTTASCEIVDAFAEYMKGAVASARNVAGGGYALVQQHHRSIREFDRSRSQSHLYTKQSDPPLGVDAGSLARYNNAVGIYATHYRVFVPRDPSVKTPEDVAAQEAQAAKNQRERDAVARAQAKRQADLSRLRELIG